MNRRDLGHSEHRDVAVRRRAWLVGIGAAVVMLLVVPAALGSDVRLMLEGEAGADFSEIWLDIPDGPLDVGSPVGGNGVVELMEGPDQDCGLFELEFHGTVESSSPEGRIEIRGVVDRASHCGEALPRHDVGEFEVTIREDGTAVGTLRFSDEAQPRRMTEYVAAPSPESSSSGFLALTALFAAVAVLTVVATVICLLKGRRMWFVFGVGVSVLMVLFATSASDLGPDDGLMAFGALISFGIIGAPLAALLLIGASRPGEPTSWWVRRGGPSGYQSAPPPVVAPSSPGDDGS